MDAGSLADWVTVGVGVAQVAVTWWIAEKLHLIGRIQHQREIDAGWQSLNLAMIENRPLRDAIGQRAPRATPSRLPADPDSVVLREAWTFYQLNMFYQVWYAERRGTIDRDYASAIWKEYLPEVHRREPQILADYLNNNGYDRRFVHCMRRRIDCLQ